jgi:hypothetical protein
MPRPWLEDVAAACMVDVMVEGEIQAGFFVRPHTVLTHFNVPLIGAEDLHIMWREDRDIRITGSTSLPVEAEVPSQSLRRGRSLPERTATTHITAISFEDVGDHNEASLTTAMPANGTRLRIPIPAQVLRGQFDRPPGVTGPYDLTCLGVDPDLINADMSGTPVMNAHTGHVFGILGRFGHPGSRVIRMAAFAELGYDIADELLHPRITVAQRRISESVRDDGGTDEATLLFRLYIPTARLYAAEASRMLAMFREWLMATSRRRVRTERSTTALGEVIEFFAEEHAYDTPSLQEKIESFSSFVEVCQGNPDAAVDLLMQTHLDRAASTGIVDRFRRELQRLERDMRYERARRLLSIQQSLEEDLDEQGLSLPTGQLISLIDSLVPDPGATVPLALMSGQEESPPRVSVQFHQQIIEHATNVITQNIAGDLNLEPQAKDLMALIERFGGNDAAELQSAIYEFEDPQAARAKRNSAKGRLLRFVGQLGNPAKDVGAELLTKWLESKGL